MGQEQFLSDEEIKAVNARLGALRRIEDSDQPVEKTAAREGFSRSTYYYGRKKLRAGASNLLDQRPKKSGNFLKLDDRVVGWVLRYVARYPCAPMTAVAKETAKMCEKYGFVSAGRKTLKRLLDRLPADLRTMILEGTTSWFQKHGLVGHLSEEVPNARWQMDISEVPIWALCMETGELFKPWKILAIDACNRTVPEVRYFRIVPTSEDVLEFLRATFLPKGDPDRPFYGVPKVLQMDNDSRFTGSALERMALALDITLDFIPRACPSADGKVERLFETFDMQLYSHLAGFSHRFAAKGSASKRAIPFPLLPRLSRQFMLEYHLAVHSELRTSPWEKSHKLLDQTIGLAWGPSEIIEATRVTETLEVQREGVKMPNNQLYSAPELKSIVGEKIDILRPPHMIDGPVDAFFAGKYVARLEPSDPKLAAAIADARRARMLELLEMRDLLLEGLRESPPIPDYSIDTKAERAKIKRETGATPSANGEEDGHDVTRHAPDGAPSTDGAKAPDGSKPPKRSTQHKKRKVRKFKEDSK